MKSANHLGFCGLGCLEEGTTYVAGIRICDSCVVRLRAIAADAGVAVDEEMLSGELRPLERRQLTNAERKLADLQEIREIARARRTA